MIFGSEYYGWDDHQPFKVSIDHGSHQRNLSICAVQELPPDLPWSRCRGGHVGILEPATVKGFVTAIFHVKQDEIFMIHDVFPLNPHYGW